MNILAKLKSCRGILCAAIVLLVELLVGCDQINMPDSSEELNVSQNIVSLNYNGHESSFNIQTGVPWEIFPQEGESMPQWIKSIVPLSGKGSSKVSVVAENNSVASRSATLRVVSQSGRSISITVNQARGVVTAGTPKTIAQIRAMMTDSEDRLVSENCTITGRVISDRTGKNISDSHFALQDDFLPGSGIMVRFMESEIKHEFSVGDQVSVNLSDAVLFYDHGVLNIQVFESETRKTTAANEPVSPVEADVMDLKNYESMLVSLPASQIADIDINRTVYGGKLKMNTKSGEINYTMVTNHLNPVALWANMPINTGSGTITGIVEVAEVENYYVFPRSISDIVLDDPRYEKVLPVKYGQVTFDGMLALTQNGTKTGARIVVPYINGDGSTISGITVTISGPGAVGLSVSQTSIKLGLGDGNAEIAIEGVPTVESQVTFTVNGIDKLTAPNNTCFTTVLPASAAREKLDVEFNLAPYPFAESGITGIGTNALIYPEGYTLSVVQGSNISLSPTSNPVDNALYTGGWNTVYNGFVISIPSQFELYGLHEVKLYAWNASKAPAVWQIFYSTDNQATWNIGDEGKSTYSPNPATSFKTDPEQFTLQFTIPESKKLPEGGTLYIKLWADISKGGAGGSVISSGNARLNYMFSVKGK